MKKFVKFVTKNFCNCISKECNLNGKTEGLNEYINTFDSSLMKSGSMMLLNDDDQCNEINKQKFKKTYSKPIVFELSLNEKKNELAETIIRFFESYKFLTVQNSGIYLLETHKRLTWINIQNITMDDIPEFIRTECEISFPGDSVVDITKAMFWMFRKSIVDVLISTVKDIDTIALSVGSTNLSSDYDITLYGKYKDSSKIIKKFEKELYILFNDKAANVFDTNVYGVAFIKITKDPFTPQTEVPNLNKLIWSDNILCNDKEVKYLNTSDNISDTQFVWNLVKIFKYIDTQQENIRKHLYNTLAMINNKKLFDISETLYNALNKDLDYSDMIESFTEFSKKFKDFDELLVITNYISLVNFYGNETYFTRGAFLNVVVGQMCKDTLNLSENDLIQSGIENLTELIIHPSKVKYLNRAKTALKKDFGNISNILVNCSEDIINCSVFLYIEIIIKEIVNIINSKTIQSDTKEFELFLKFL
jgi:hypothetical protein